MSATLVLLAACSADPEPQLTEAYQVRLDAESERQELEAELAQAEADAKAEQKRRGDQERQRAAAAIEAGIQNDFLSMAGVVTSRVNELSLVGLDQDCLASGFRDNELPLVTDPGRPFAEFDATQVTIVMLDCGALDAYMTNLNQLGLGPTLSDEDRSCLRDYVGEIAGGDFQLLLVAELMGEAGVVESATRFDAVYNTTWDGADSCNIDW